MATSAHQLFLTADHVKLLLLERQRALSLNIEAHTQDGHITRSLDSLRQGIDSLQQQAQDQQSAGQDASDLQSQLSRLQSQYHDLNSQFHGPDGTPTSSALKHPNDPALAPDSSAASKKAVRFRDSQSGPYRDDPPDPQTQANRAALFEGSSYTDDPSPPDQSQLDNQQIHKYHQQVLREQDDQLDTLGQSIGRQRMLGIEMGNELDDQNAMLDDVERGTDRFQSNLDRARGRLGKVARKAKDNWSWVTIAILIIILVLLLVILK